MTLPLKTFKSYGLRGKAEFQGQDFSVTETMKLLEEFSCNLSLSEIVTNANSNAYLAIEKCGNEVQKAKYLPGLFSGDSVGAICVAEPESGSDITATTTTAAFDKVNNTYVLNGTKTWVMNGKEADIYTVFAQVEGQLSAFIVEKGRNGIKVGKRLRTIGLKSVPFHEISFENVEIPAENLISEVGSGITIFNDVFVNDRYFSGSKISALLRGLIDHTVKHMMRREVFGVKMTHIDLIKKKLSDMSSHVYALESMTYLSAGIADVQSVEDIAVESAMCRLNALKTAKMVVQECFSILGSRSFNEDEEEIGFSKAAKDLQMLEFWEGSEDILHRNISMTGILHARDSQVFRSVNPFRLLRNYADDWRLLKGQPRMRLKVEHDVHPTLHRLAGCVERSLYRLAHGTKTLLNRNGNNEDNLSEETTDLKRISEAATAVFASVSVLSRSNRTYCQGHSHGEHEVEMAHFIGYETEFYVEREMNKLLKNEQDKELYRRIAGGNGINSVKHPALP